MTRLKNIIVCLLLAGSIISFLPGKVCAQQSENNLDKKSFFEDATDFINEAKLNKADKNFDHFAYTDALVLYEELAQAEYQMTHVTKRLADGYRLTHRPDLSETWYALLVQKDSISPDNYYHYAQVLRSNGKYEDSKQWFAKFNELNGEDSRGAKYKDAGDFVEKMKNMPERFEVKNAELLNSQYSDFGGYFVNGKLVFASARDDGYAVKNKYAWDNKPFLDLYYVIKTSAGFGSPHGISNKINSGYHEGPACFDKSGLVMYFTRNNYNGRMQLKGKEVNHYQLLRSEYKNGDWTNTVELPFNEDNFNVGHPTLSADGTKLYFASNMPGGKGGSDIYVVDVNADGSFGKPENLGDNINTEGNEGFPFIHDTGVLYFASDGHVGLGGLDVFYSIPNKKGDYQSPKNLSYPINGPRDDFSFWLAPEQQGGYFSSNRPGGKGGDNIYSFTMSKPILAEFVVLVTAIDKETSKPLERAELVAVDEAGEIIAEAISGKDGTFKFAVDPGAHFTVKAKAEKYIDATENYTTEELEEGQDEMTFNIPLEKDPGITLIGLITCKQTGEPLVGAHINIIDKYSKKEIVDINTPEDGRFNKILMENKVNDTLNYTVSIHLEGYLDKIVDFKKVITKPGPILLHKFLSFELDKVEVGTDLAKIIDIQPIYFDLNKSDIREDAATELDKIVKVMTENPNMTIELGSHTDSRGSDAYNLSLSDRRAKSSAKYIVSRGIDKNRITGKGYGEKKLINKCKNGVECSKDEHQANRRTEFIIVKM